MNVLGNLQRDMAEFTKKRLEASGKLYRSLVEGTKVLREEPAEKAWQSYMKKLEQLKALMEEYGYSVLSGIEFKDMFGRVVHSGEITRDLKFVTGRREYRLDDLADISELTCKRVDSFSETTGFNIRFIMKAGLEKAVLGGGYELDCSNQ